MILGAIIGDMIGVPYEFRQNRYKSKDFPLFNGSNRPSDDSVLTIANMSWLLGTDLKEAMLKWCHKYPKAGYGGMFRRWLMDDNRHPYNSLGNGSAMRVSPVAWIANSLDECLDLAKQSAEITHNHAEGIKGAQATAAAIYMARIGSTKEEIKEYISKEFGYNLDRTLDEIRPTYHFDSTCQGSVPESIICFLEGTSYEDTVRNAVSLGGDTDTQAAIAGSIAEAFYGIPKEIQDEALKIIPKDMLEVIEEFSEKCQPTEAPEATPFY